MGDLNEHPTEAAAQAASDALRLTINHQSQRSGESYDCAGSQGALFPRGTSLQRFLNPGCIHFVRQELDPSALGRHASEANEDRRDRALVTGCDWFTRHKSQRQVCHVGFVLPCRALGIHEPDLFRKSGWFMWKAGPKHGCSCECETAESAHRLGAGTGQSRTYAARVPRLTIGPPGCRTGNAAR